MVASGLNWLVILFQISLIITYLPVLAFRKIKVRLKKLQLLFIKTKAIHCISKVYPASHLFIGSQNYRNFDALQAVFCVQAVDLTINLESLLLNIGFVFSEIS